MMYYFTNLVKYVIEGSMFWGDLGIICFYYDQQDDVWIICVHVLRFRYFKS